jgi:hypothetical protein
MMDWRVIGTMGLPVATIAWAGLGLLGTLGSEPEVAGIGFAGAGIVQVVILKKLLSIEGRLAWLEGRHGERLRQEEEDQDPGGGGRKRAGRGG